MSVSILSLRCRVFLFFAFLVLASTLMIAGAIFMAHQKPVEQLPRLLAIYTSVAAVFIALVLLLVWQLFDRYIATALQSMARQMQCAMHADYKNEKNGFSSQELYQYLGPINEAADHLIHAYQTLKHQQTPDHAEAVDSAAHGQILASILRDLDVGVLVMNRKHEILLYNQRAFCMMGNPECFGLARKVHSLFEGGDLLNKAEQLLASIPSRVESASIPVILTLTNEARHFTGKIKPVSTDENEISGYVLLFEETSPTANSLLTQQQVNEGRRVSGADSDRKLPARPEFYDFDLFNRPVTSDHWNHDLRSLDYVVFDTETTGLRPSRGDKVISIAAVRIVNGRVLSGERFDELINPQMSVPKSSIVFHGITDDMLKDKPTIEDILPQFARFAGESVLVAHNAAFDMKFIELQAENCQVTFENPVLDTVLLSAFLHDHSHKHTLDDLAERYGIQIEGRHTALGDALATAHVFTKMMAQLSVRNIKTLKEASDISDKMTHIKRKQRDY